MKLETFFEKFDQFADAPDAVAKMRELVLHLAFSGQLVKSNGARIVGPLDSILAEASINGVSKGPTFDTTATEILKISAGTSRRDFFVNEDDFKHVDLPPNEVAKFRLEPGDLLACRFNGNLHYVGRFSYYRGVSGRTQVNPDKLIRFRIDRSKHCPRYVCYAMNSADARTAIESMCATTAGNIGLSAGKLKTVEIPLPPLAEQKRIVAKVDELMALCDRLEAQQQERETRHTALARASLARFADAPTPANLPFLFHPSYAIPPADLRKSILTLAVQGKLVPRDPNDEPAEEVLARIAATKLRLQKTGEIGKEKPVEPLQPDSLPFEAPDSWRWAKLAELTELITKGSSPKWQGIAYVSESEGILFITSENVGNYVLRKVDDLKYVSKGFNEIEPRSILKRGDILMNLVGASIGRTAVYDLHDGANINQAVALIRLVRETDGVCPRFLLHYLNSPFAIDYMLSSRVVNAQPNISLTDAREFAVPIPPLAEQRRIVAKVEQLMALVDALETQLAASRATAANLLSALVAELTTPSTL